MTLVSDFFFSFLCFLKNFSKGCYIIIYPRVSREKDEFCDKQTDGGLGLFVLFAIKFSGSTLHSCFSLITF